MNLDFWSKEHRTNYRHQAYPNDASKVYQKEIVFNSETANLSWSDKEGVNQCRQPNCDANEGEKVMCTFSRLSPALVNSLDWSNWESVMMNIVDPNGTHIYTLVIINPYVAEQSFDPGCLLTNRCLCGSQGSLCSADTDTNCPFKNYIWFTPCDVSTCMIITQNKATCILPTQAGHMWHS